MATKTEKHNFIIHSDSDKINLDNINKNWKTMDNYSLVSTKSASTSLSGGSTAKINWHIVQIIPTSGTKFVFMSGVASVGALNLATIVSSDLNKMYTSKTIKVPLPVKLAATYSVQFNYMSTGGSTRQRLTMDYSSAPNSNYGSVAVRILSLAPVKSDTGKLYVQVYGKAVS